MTEWACCLYCTGYATVVVEAEDEETARLKAEQFDPWDMEIEVSATSCESVEPE